MTKWLIHHVGAEPELYTVEYNSTKNDVNEQVIKGNVAIIKHTDNGETQIETPEEGAVFEVYLKSAGSFDAAEETERDTLICDENGFAQTKDMPYGIYTVHQTSGWDGRELMKDFDVFICKDSQTYRYLINNANFESYIKIVKKDIETGKVIPYAGAGFQIYDPEGNLVTMKFTYPEVTEIDTFYTTADGGLITPQTLEYGKGYSLVEVQAPYGYVLDSEPVYFDVEQENSEEESGITIVKVERSNVAQKGKITVGKSGEVFSRVSGNKGLYQPIFAVDSLEGAVYEITAAEDIITTDGTVRAEKGEVVDTITTGEDGTAESKELYLGKYEVKEVTAPYAYFYQLVEGKQKFISQIMTSKSPVRSAEDVDEVALSFAEVKMLATGDERFKEKMDLDMQVAKLKVLKQSYLSEHYDLEDRILKHYPQEIKEYEKRIVGYENDAKIASQHMPQGEDKFCPMTLNGVTYKEKADAGGMLLAICKENPLSQPIQIGSYRGFQMEVFYDTVNAHYCLNLCGMRKYKVDLGTDALGNLTRIENEIAKIPARLEAAKTRKEETTAQLETAKEEVKKPFAFENELKEKTERLNALNIELNLNEKDKTVIDDEPEQNDEQPEKKCTDRER